MKLNVMGQVVNMFWWELVDDNYCLKQIGFDQDDKLIFQANLQGEWPNFRADISYKDVLEFSTLLGAHMHLQNPTEPNDKDN